MASNFRFSRITKTDDEFFQRPELFYPFFCTFSGPKLYYLKRRRLSLALTFFGYVRIVIVLVLQQKIRKYTQLFLAKAVSSRNTCWGCVCIVLQNVGENPTLLSAKVVSSYIRAGATTLVVAHTRTYVCGPSHGREWLAQGRPDFFALLLSPLSASVMHLVPSICRLPFFGSL